ncbi:MAG: TatD family hydrolase [Mogibacterium sp.]|nr:TatD family hydrolase [Mogibacterium sp.]
MLFDAHTHLNFEKLTDEERRALAAEIEESQLVYIIDVADCVSSAKQALQDSDDYDWCYAAVGIHPDHASVYTDGDIEEIRRLAAHPKAMAIGEIGLDFYYGTDDREEQQELFRKQIRLANELRMPIMIHSRDANQLTMDILMEEGAFSEERKAWFPDRPAPGTMAPGAPGSDMKIPGEYTAAGDEPLRLVPDARVQMHCYSGSPEMAEEYVKLGATISLGGPITFKNGKKAAEAARRTPIEFLLSETDAPYMAPEPLRGRPNKPYYVEHVVRRMAMIKGLSYEETSRILTGNGKHFFDIP